MLGKQLLNILRNSIFFAFFFLYILFIFKAQFALYFIFFSSFFLFLKNFTFDRTFCECEKWRGRRGRWGRWSLCGEWDGLGYSRCVGLWLSITRTKTVVCERLVSWELKIRHWKYENHKWKKIILKANKIFTWIWQRFLAFKLPLDLAALLGKKYFGNSIVVASWHSYRSFELLIYIDTYVFLFRIFD